MESYVVRMWLPDRPGALGQVASRIGAVRGEIVGIEILERGAGRAIDELVVDLPDASLKDLLVQDCNVALSPGVGFGPGGEGYARFALIENEQRIQQGIRNLRKGLTKLG